MTTAHDVARYIAAKTPLRGEVQLQKLLHYVQAWSLAWDGEPAFDEPVEAWRMGPVVRSMWHVTPEPDESVALTDQQKANVDAVIAHYAGLHGRDLIERTHSEEPWQEAWRNRSSNERGSEAISHETMRRACTEQRLRGEGPRRRVVGSPAPPVELDDVRRRAVEAARRWSHTLDLLAR